MRINKNREFRKVYWLCKSADFIMIAASCIFIGCLYVWAYDSAFRIENINTLQLLKPITIISFYSTLILIPLWFLRLKKFGRVVAP